MALIRKLEPTDDLKSFRSRENKLDWYLKKRSLSNQRLFGVTYVEVNGETICGFATVAPASVRMEEIGLTNAPPDVPVLLLGRLATDKRHEGKGVGSRLLAFVARLAVDQYETTGCAALITDAKAGSVQWYEKRGFRPFLTQDPAATETRMYLEIGSILAAILTTSRPR